MSTLGKTIAENIRHFRERKSWTQVHLADQVQCSQSTISGVESGSLRPGLDLLERIAESLGVEPWKLFVAAGRQRELRHLPKEIQELMSLRESSDPQFVQLAEDLARLIADHLKLVEKSQRRRGRPGKE